MNAPAGAQYAAVAEYLCGLKPRGTKFGVHRMRPFASALGHPENALPWIHVAGTNGKGSVAAMIESMLRAAGYKVGLFTSPHLVHLGERVQVNRTRLTENQIINYVRELVPVADRVANDSDPDNRPSFFEFMTAIGLLEFERSGCDVGVIEVGLGGEFDATNIIEPEVSVITSIGLDHCDLLGNTVAMIARAKAGIIKAGRPVVMGRLPADAAEVIQSTAQSRGARVVSVKDVYGEAIEGYPETNLEGDYQRWNAATAVLAIRQLGPSWKIPPVAVSKGLLSVDWPGRWERRRVDGRLVILDSSHNAEGAEVLESNLTALVAESHQRPLVMVGALGGERASALINVVSRHAREIYFVVPAQSRATSFEELETMVPPTFAGPVFRGSVAGIFPGGDRCTVGSPGDLVVVTGSIYLLGEVMSQLEKGPSSDAM
jgi:dihydrofolate synthase/folylpolyglutamate synthase